MNAKLFAIVIARESVAKRRSIEEFQNIGVMHYKGDLKETSCLALGEAQACGSPAAAGRSGSVAEDVINGETGAIADDDSMFADPAIKLLTDTAMWARRHAAVLAKQGRRSWPEAARACEELKPR